MLDHQVVQVNGLAFAYGRHQVLHDVTFSLSAGEIVTLIGASGAGKSTLLHLLSGILKPSKGMVSIPPQQISYMMQQDLLLSWRTVLDNVTLVTELGPLARSQDQEARALLAEVGLGGVELRYPQELSGGMRQRVALARSLLLGKPLLILDEPFTALDVLLREELYALLRRLQQRNRLTVLMVTHDFRDALYLSDRIIHLKGGAITDEWLIENSVRHDPVQFGVHYAKLRSALNHSG